jgi:CubicO group peptidase (beta-lactamase class C family)
MTATLAAMLVEQGKLRWDSKIGEVLPEARDSMDESWQTATLEMLLTHRAGAPVAPPDNLWKNAFKRVGPPMEQRTSFVSGLLLRRTQAPAGTKFLYSNQGYAIAGAMIERAGGKPWEELMRTMLFEPCNMDSAGFGAPATAGKIDQPWGHLGAEMTPVPPADPGSDNPPAIGPAGTVHCSLSDLARFAAMHSLGERTGTMFLKKEGFRKLHKAPEGQAYASGWATMGSVMLNHAGSNTMFYCVMWIFPGKDAVFVAATNCAGEKAATGTDEAVSEMAKKVMK